MKNHARMSITPYFNPLTAGKRRAPLTSFDWTFGSISAVQTLNVFTNNTQKGRFPLAIMLFYVKTPRRQQVSKYFLKNVGENQASVTSLSSSFFSRLYCVARRAPSVTTTNDRRRRVAYIRPSLGQRRLRRSRQAIRSGCERN